MTKEHDGGDVTYLTVHAAGEELEALPVMGHPFYEGWGPGPIAVVLSDDDTTDWHEVRELVTDSYRLIAPKKLTARLAAIRPPEQVSATAPARSLEHRHPATPTADDP